MEFLNKVIKVCRAKGFVRHSEITSLATDFRDGLLVQGHIEDSDWTRLRICKFGRKLVAKLMEMNKSALANHVPRSADHVRFVAFNSLPVTVGMFFAKVSDVFRRYRIEGPEQIYSLDDKGVSLGREITRACSRSATKEAGKYATIPKPSILNDNRISIAVCVRADGDAVCPATVDKGVFETGLCAGAGACQKVMELLPRN